MSISFNRTREQLANLVLRKLGVAGSGQLSLSTEMGLVYEAIDLRLKEFHHQGIFWRKVSEIPLSFTIPANVNSASASVDIAFPIAMHVTDVSMDVPVDIISIREYADIENKSAQGIPEKALWKGSAEWIFWPIPTANTTAKLTYQAIVDDTSAGSVMDIDIPMLRALKDVVAYDLADNYGKPEPIMQRWMREAAMAEARIRNLNAQRVDYPPVQVDQF